MQMDLLSKKRKFSEVDDDGVAIDLDFLQYSDEEIEDEDETWIDLSEIGAHSLTSIHPRARCLNIKESSISTLPPLPDTLERLIVDQSNVTDLPNPLPRSLEMLSIDCTGVANLPQLPENLENLWVSWSNVTVLPKLPSNLQMLSLERCKITVLPPLPNTLTRLNISNTLIESLPDQLPTCLVELRMESTKIKSLPKLPETLRVLTCDGSLLTELPDPLPSAMSYLTLDHTAITILPKVSRKCCLTLPDTLRLCNPLNVNQNEAYYRSMAPERCKEITGKTWYIAAKYLYKVKQVKIIQRNLHNWLYKPVCADGTLGIVARLGMKKCGNLPTVPMTMKEVQCVL